MIRNNLGLYAPVVFSSVLVSLFTLFASSPNVTAQDAPDYLLGNLTFEKNLTKEQIQEAIDKVSNYLDNLKKEASGNETKLNVLLIEDMAKRNIIDEETKQGFLSFVATLPKPPMSIFPEFPGSDLPPGTIPSPTFPDENVTDFLKDLDTSSNILDNIAKNNSDSQVVVLMTDIIKKRVTDIGTFATGNGTDTDLPPVTIDMSWGEAFAKGATCALIGGALSGGSIITTLTNAWTCTEIM